MDLYALVINAVKLADDIEADELGDWHRAGDDEDLTLIVKALREYASNRTAKKAQPYGDSRP